MQIKDANIARLIERIGEHYRSNISNRFVRPALLQLSLEKKTWDLLETLTEKTDQFKYQGLHLDELYQQIIAAANFVSVTRREVVPTLRNRLPGGVSGSDRVLRDMAVNNFSSNLQVFAGLVNQLYVGLVDLDKAGAKGRNPLYMSIPELNDVSRLLVGS